MSDIAKIGHVIKIEKNTLDLLGEIKKAIGIPKYKIIAMAVASFYKNNEEIKNLIILDKETKKSMQRLSLKLKEEQIWVIYFGQ